MDLRSGAACAKASVTCRGDCPGRDQPSLVFHDGRLAMFGGRDAFGAGTNSLFLCPIQIQTDPRDAKPDRGIANRIELNRSVSDTDRDVGARIDTDPVAHGIGFGEWRLVECGGELPMPRWGHAAVVWGEQMWVLGGRNSSVDAMEDLYRFDFASRRWIEVRQCGQIPSGSAENGDPRCRIITPKFVPWGAKAVYVAPDAAFSIEVRLLDFCSGEWTLLTALGGPEIDNVEGAVIHDNCLYVAGWCSIGTDPSPLIEIWKLFLIDDEPQWEMVRATGDIPLGCTNCTFCAILDSCTAILWGGLIVGRSPPEVSAEARMVDLESGKWTCVEFETRYNTPPGPRHLHAAVCLPSFKGVACLGGSSRVDMSANIQYLDVIAVPKAFDVLQSVAPMFPVAAGGTCGTPPLSSCHLEGFCVSSHLSDVTLVASGRHFPAHRVILASASPRFQGMFVEDSETRANVGTRVVEVGDVTPYALELILKFIYGCLVTIPEDRAAELFSASDRYGLLNLRSACMGALMREINADTVGCLALLSSEHQCEEIMEACVNFTGGSPDRLAAVLASQAYLKLNRADPELGQKFMQAATRRLVQVMGPNAAAGQFMRAETPASEILIPARYDGRRIVAPGAAGAHTVTRIESIVEAGSNTGSSCGEI